jgi:hypothetical protein
MSKSDQEVLARIARRWARRIMVRDLEHKTLPEDAHFIRRKGDQDFYRKGDWVYSVDRRTKKVLDAQMVRLGGLDPADFFDMGEAPELSPEQQAVADFEQQAGGMSQVMSVREILRPTASRKLATLLGPGFRYISPHKGWFVFPGKGVAAGGQARRLGQQIFRSLTGRRNLPASVVALHKVPLWVGTQNGTAVRVDPPAKKAAASKWRVYLFSNTGKTLFEKVYAARDERDAERKALALVKPQLRRFDNAEDWVVESVDLR